MGRRGGVFFRIVCALVAFAFAALILTPFHEHWADKDLLPGALFFVVFWIVLYRVAVWVFSDHPAQIQKHLPITGKEFREKRKAFYDWMSGQDNLKNKPRRRPPNDYI